MKYLKKSSSKSSTMPILKNSLLFMISLLIFSGCASVFVKPEAGNASNPARVNNPVLIELDWSDISNKQSGSPSISLDSTDVTANFGNPYCCKASAYFTLVPGKHTASFSMPRNSSFWSRYQVVTNFEVVEPGFTLKVEPSIVSVKPGSSANTLVSLQPQYGYNGMVTIEVTGLPSSVSHNITPLTGGNQWRVDLSAANTANESNSKATVTGTGPCSPNCSGTKTASDSLDVAVIQPSPSIISINPIVQTKGGTITISGLNFSSNCADNVISFGSVNVTPTFCSISSLNAQVPSQAAYGKNQVSINTKGKKSNSVTFTVGRQTGNFVEITSAISGQTSTGRICSNGSIGLEICAPDCSGYPAGAYVARFKRTADNGNVGTVEFRKNNQRVGGLGGAGFNLCNSGIVLDADATGYSPQLMAFNFLDLEKGTGFQANPYTFNFVTPAGNASYNPRIFRSPDGTIILVITPANIGPSQLTAGFIDQVNSGRIISEVGLTSITGVIAATVSADNKITFSFGSSTALIDIP